MFLLWTSQANLVCTDFILVRLWRRILAYRNTLDSVPGTNQYWTVGVKFLAQGNNGLSLTGFEPMWLANLRLLARRVNHSTTPALYKQSCMLFINRLSVLGLSMYGIYMVGAMEEVNTSLVQMLLFSALIVAVDPVAVRTSFLLYA